LVLPGETIPVDVWSHSIVSFFYSLVLSDQSIELSDTRFAG
jgi:hypothetical protein